MTPLTQVSATLVVKLSHTPTDQKRKELCTLVYDMKN